MFLLREVKAVFSLTQCKPKSLPHDLNRGVVGQLEVVDACHDGGEEIVGILWWFHCLADDGERRVERFKTWTEKGENGYDQALRYYNQ